MVFMIKTPVLRSCSYKNIYFLREYSIGLLVIINKKLNFFNYLYNSIQSNVEIITIVSTINYQLNYA